MLPKWSYFEDWKSCCLSPGCDRNCVQTTMSALVWSHQQKTVADAEMPSVPFLQYSVLFFDENTSKILQNLGKYCFFSQFITTHVYCTMGQNTVFHPKYSFSAMKILQTILQGWHPCRWGYGSHLFSCSKPRTSLNSLLSIGLPSCGWQKQVFHQSQQNGYHQETILISEIQRHCGWSHSLERSPWFSFKPRSWVLVKILVLDRSEKICYILVSVS